MNSPSAQQLDAFRNTKPGPLVLFYEFTAPAVQGVAAALTQAAQATGGELRWMGDEQEIMCGRIAHYQMAASLHFASRDAARAFIEAAGHRAAVSACTALQVAVLGEQPRAVALISSVMAKVLPHWPFDSTVETTEEPGVDVSTTMPTSKMIAAVRSHPDQNTPVVMINWLKFKPGDGKAAYYRYGKVALTTTHHLGAKLIHAARYQQILIGNGGDPGAALWDEFALMQYPGRATFGRMAALRRYRRALADREAGLAEYGQGLTVTKPAEEFVWRG